MNGAQQLLDPDRVRRLFDLAGNVQAWNGGNYGDDPYPVWHGLRQQSAVHPGTVHALSGVGEDLVFHGLPSADRPHFSAFSWEACDAAYRNPEIFASSAEAVDLEDGEPGPTNSMLSMGGAQHRRYRALVQPSFSPARVRWWIENWIESTVHALIDSFEGNGRAELNVELCAAIPVLTITGSFGVPVDQALDVRESLARPERIIEMLAPIVAARREQPEDDLISVLVEAEITDEDGSTHRLSDAEIHSFSLLLLAAGSGTTWKQMGITLAALLQRPELLAAVRADRSSVAPGDRGVGPLVADGSDVLALGHRRPRLLRQPSAQGIGAPHLHRRRQSRPRSLGAVPTSSTRSARPDRPWPSVGDRTCASGSTSPGRR